MNFSKLQGVLHVVAAGVTLSFSATPGAAAEEFEPVQGCLDARISANEPVAECVKQVQSLCLSYDAPSMAGADCYRRAKDHWGGLISERMQRIRETASEQLSTIAAIEVKYDLKGNLMQCDRMEELSLVQKDPDDGTVYIRLRCEATAVGMAFAKLYYQSQQIK